MAITEDRPAVTNAARVTTLVVVCLALFMALLDSTAISLILPAIRADLNADITGLIWIADGYVLVFAALLLTSGSLGDRLGRARMFLIGLAIFIGGSVLCAYASDLPTLVAGRVVQGAGAALVTPQTLAILTSAFPSGKERARAFGIWSGVSGLALILGPVVGGTLTDLWGWQSVFWINVPIGLVTLLLGARVLRVTAGGTARPDAPLRQAIDLPGQLLTIGWLGTLTFALIEGARLGWTSPVILALFGCAGFGLAALLAVERRVTHPMLRLDLFRSVTFSASAVVIALVAFGMYASFFLISMFLQQVQEYSATAAGVRFLPAMCAVVVTSPLAGLLAGRVGSRLPVVAGTTLIGVSLLLLSRVEPHTPYSNWVWLMITFGIGIGLTIPPVNSALMGSVPSDRTGIAAATGQTGQQIGALVGIAILGALVTGGFQRVVGEGAAAAGLSTADTDELARNLFAEQADTISQRPEVTALVARALTDGIHWGLQAAGIAALVAAAVALAIRSGQPTNEETPSIKE